MRIIVSKFGGSSTATSEMFKKLAGIISDHPERRYIVLSAPGTGSGCSDKITNLLYQCHDQHSSGQDFSETLSKICDRFSSIAQGLSLPDPHVFVVREVRQALSVSRDHTASRGEYLCALLFSRWTGIPMVDAADIIHFSDSGKTDSGKTMTAIMQMKARYPRAIIPGFYGAMPDGRLRTFPRNGSDITGALVAAGVGADLYENWSDVEGFMTADPSVVKNALFNPHLSYRQMHVLSKEGARILHPDCLEPVSVRGIPTLLKNTLNPYGPGTLISDDFKGSVPCVTGTMCRYIHADDPDASKLPDSIPFRCLTDIFGRECILINEINSPFIDTLPCAACISVFGLTSHGKEILYNTLSPLHCFESSGYTKYLVDISCFGSAIQHAHEVLIKNL